MGKNSNTGETGREVVEGRRVAEGRQMGEREREESQKPAHALPKPSHSPKTNHVCQPKNRPTPVRNFSIKKINKI